MTEPRPRADYHHGDLQKAALTAALAAIGRGGAEEVSMRSIAAEVGVAHRALYRHYADRDALLQACAAEGYRALAMASGDATDNRTFAEAYLRFAIARPHLYDLMTRAHRGLRSPDLETATRLVIRNARNVIGDDRSVQRLWTILHGGLSLHAAGALRARDADALVGFLVSLIEEP